MTNVGERSTPNYKEVLLERHESETEFQPFELYICLTALLEEISYYVATVGDHGSYSS